jgi:nickel-dependent lactate racemase
MTRQLCYGRGQILRIDPPADAMVADFTSPPGQPLDSPADAVSAALAGPCDYPPINQATIPGDHVVLAVDRCVPQLSAVVAGVVRSLLATDISPRDITVLLTQEESLERKALATAGLASDVAAEVQVVQHDGDDQRNLTYLAASKENKPIYVSRQLFDADVVLPIGCLRPPGAFGYLGIHGGLFPAFSDRKTQETFRAPDSALSPVQRRRRQEEAEEAAWLLGIQIVLQIVPGAGDTILHVLAGDARAVARQGQPLSEAAWVHRLPQRTGLVVAAIEGGPEQQTWDSFARALAAALDIVAEDGAIVLCTDLCCSPGPALRKLAASSDPSEALGAIRRDRSPDAVSAALLIDAARRTTIYLLSGLEREFVEDLGLGYVSRADEINRLSRQYGTCTLVADAHRAALATMDSES